MGLRAKTTRNIVSQDHFQFIPKYKNDDCLPAFLLLHIIKSDQTGGLALPERRRPESMTSSLTLAGFPEALLVRSPGSLPDFVGVLLVGGFGSSAPLSFLVVCLTSSSASD